MRGERGNGQWQSTARGSGCWPVTAREIGAKLVQVSTDYVFDGGKGTPYVEEDPIGPLSIYGESKLAGELNAAMAPEYLIVRTQWLYGIHGKNFRRDHASPCRS